MRDVILGFIRRFHQCRDIPSIVDVFTNGCCYWFAYILHARFPDSEIVYSDRFIHFATKINGIVYDIRGVVPSQDEYVSWEEFRKADETHADRIIRDCINF